MPKYKIKESFSWMAAPEFKIVNTGKNTVTIKGVAVKKNQISRNKRRYVEEELIKGARTFIGRPVTINHAPYEKTHPMYDGRKVPGNIRWMEYEDGRMEYMVDIKKQPYVDLIRNHSVEVRGVSIEADYLYNRCSHCGKKFYDVESYKNHMINEHFIKNFNYEPRGIVGRALSLVISPEEPGIPDTTIELAETAPNGFSRLLETVIIDRKEKEDMTKKLGDKAVITPISRITPDRAKQLKEQGEDTIKKDEAAVDPQSQQNPPTHPVLPHEANEPEEELADNEKEKPVPTPEQPETKVTEQDEPPQEEPSKDEHGCVIGKEKWNGTECVPLATEQLECPEGYHPNEDGTACIADEEPETEETVDETPPSQQPAAHPVTEPHTPTEPEEELADTIPEAPTPTLPPPPEIKVTEITLPPLLKIGEMLLAETVEKRGDQWCVIHCTGSDAGKAIKCFPTKEQAEKMHAAIQANKETQESWKTGFPAIAEVESSSISRDVKLASSVNQVVEAIATLSLSQPKQLKALQEYLDKSMVTTAKHFKAIETLIKTNGKTRTEHVAAKLKEIVDSNKTQTEQTNKKLKETVDSVKALQNNKKPLEILATDIAKRDKATNAAISKLTESTSNQLTKLKEQVNTLTQHVESMKSEQNTLKEQQITKEQLTDIQNQIAELKTMKETFEDVLKKADGNAEARDKKIGELEEQVKNQKDNQVKETADALTEFRTRLDNLEDKVKPQFKAHSQKATETEEPKDKPLIVDPITEGRK